MDVLGVVVARRRPSDVDVLAPVGGVPMVVRSVRCLLSSELMDRVVVLAPDGGRDEVARACAGLPVDVEESASRRPRPGSGIEVVVLHDAARPLAPPALVTDVVAAVRAGADGAVPVLPLVDTVKLVDEDGLVRGSPDRSALRVVQTPQAVRADRLDPAGTLRDADPVAAAARAVVRTVTGHPWAFPVRSAWALELAELLVGSGDR